MLSRTTSSLTNPRSHSPSKRAIDLSPLSTVGRTSGRFRSSVDFSHGMHGKHGPPPFPTDFGSPNPTRRGQQTILGHELGEGRGNSGPSQKIWILGLAERMFILDWHSTGGDLCQLTARLSKKFYDTLGEDLAIELVDWFNQVDATYRSDLRELNESNFQRFDAKLEQRLAQQDVRWERRIAELEFKLEHRLVQQDRRIAELDAIWEKRIGSLKAELIKWMFLFWVGTVGAVLTIMRMTA